MKEFIISEAKVETAVLVGLITQMQDERKTNEYLDELAFLAETAGAEVVKRFTQKLPTANSVTYVGKGKLEEIRQYIRTEEEEEREVGMVIFDDELSAKQIRNIEAELKVKILDRTSLILDIFAMRAQTANAKRRWNWLSTNTCYRVCNDSGPTWNVRVVAPVAEAVKEVLWDFADRVKRSSKWTAVSSSTVCHC